MSSLPADPVLSALVSIVLKASALLALAAFAQFLLRRHGSAATRHFVWTVTVGALLVLPVLAAVLPSWAMAIRQTSIPTTIIAPTRTPVEDAVIAAASPSVVPVAGEPAPDRRSVGEEPTRERAGAYAVAIYFAGLSVMLLMAAIQRRSARRLVAEAAPVTDPSWTTLLSDCAGRM